MAISRLSRLLPAILLLFVLSAEAQNDPDREEWIQLFNGENLDGWVVKINGYALGDNYGDTFRVADGLMQVRHGQYEGDFNERFGHIFHTTKYSHYIVAVEHRFVGDQAKGDPRWARRNSGIMVHSQSPESMGKDQNFPISIEVQLLGGLGQGPRATANLCTPGTHVVMDGKLLTRHCTTSTSKTYDGEQWVRVEVLVLGSSTIRHRIDGETVLSYEMPQMGGGTVNGFDKSAKRDGELLTDGYISLQSESHPIDFRKVELLNLAGCMDPKASNYKSYFVKSEPSQCRF